MTLKIPYKNILVTGGAGFVGSHLSIALKNHFDRIQVTAFDNLIRRGSEFNLPRLVKAGVNFRKGDVRSKKDLSLDGKYDLIIDCSAEPSVTAGTGGSPEYVIDTNLFGACNCFEMARKCRADVVFLSTSRVYPIDLLNNLDFCEKDSRFELKSRQKIPGAARQGISEEFPLNGYRSIYGSTKLGAEMLLIEYEKAYGIKAFINRFGVIAGPWQFGKVDQGIIAHWAASHIFNQPLKYMGYGGFGKQVRDVLHIDDAVGIIIRQITQMDKISGKVFNIGGGVKVSFSLLELTDCVSKLAGKKIHIGRTVRESPNDVKLYITNFQKAGKLLDFKPEKSKYEIVEDVVKWIYDHKNELRKIFT